MVAAQKLIIRIGNGPADVGIGKYQLWTGILTRDLGAEFTVHERGYAEFTVRVGESVVQRRWNELMSVQQWVTLWRNH